MIRNSYTDNKAFAEELKREIALRRSYAGSGEGALESTHGTYRRYEQDMGLSRRDCCAWCELLLIIILSSVLLVGVFGLTLFWVMFYRGGLAWDTEPWTKFNWHPTLMVAGFITLSGFSILMFRFCRFLKHFYAKLIHAFFHALAIPCIAFGFLAVLESHALYDPPRQNFYSLHSWLGLITMGMFGAQFIVGFLTFLVFLCCERMTYGFRSAMVPVHASFGVATFMLAIATAVTGLVEKDRQQQIENDGLVSFFKTEAEHWVMNFIAIVLVALGVIIPVAIRRSNAPASAKVYVTERV